MNSNIFEHLEITWSLVSAVIGAILGWIAQSLITRSKILQNTTAASENLVEQLTTLSQTVRELHEENLKLRERMTTMQERVTSLEQEIVRMKVERGQLTMQISIIKEENEQLRAMLDSLTKRSEEFERGIHLLLAQITEHNLKPVWHPKDMSTDEKE